MKRDLRFECTYPHPPDLVWEALTEPSSLSEWLMPVFDFVPEVDREFTFRVKPQPGWDGIVRCRVLEVIPEQLLRFSWHGGGTLNTEVKISIEPVAGGTRLLLEHNGFEGLKNVIISTFMGGGWSRMTSKKLPAVLARLAGAQGISGDRPSPAAEMGNSAGPTNPLDECRPTMYRRVVGYLTKLLPK